MNGLEIQMNGADGELSMAGAPAVFRDETTGAKDRSGRRFQRVPLMWRGLPVSPGVAQGEAVVPLSGEAYGSIRAGSILVCSIMEPSLIEVLHLCDGLVCDQGGMLNPAAMTAREYGIPVVSGIRCATEGIMDGDRIRIDGRTGTVAVLSRPVRPIRSV